MYIGFVLMLCKNLDKFKNGNIILYNALWNLLKYYSYVQFYINKNVIIPFYYNSQIIYKQIKCIIDTPYKYIIINDGNEIMRFKKINELILFLKKNKNNNDDNLIYYTNNDKIYYNNINEFIHIYNMNFGDYDVVFEISKIKFISAFITIKLKDENINLPLELKKFMLIGNKILDKSFVLWYCNKYLKLDIDLIENYKIDIIDQDINQIKIDINDYIKIYENYYVIHNKWYNTEMTLIKK